MGNFGDDIHGGVVSSNNEKMLDADEVEIIKNYKADKISGMVHDKVYKQYKTYDEAVSQVLKLEEKKHELYGIDSIDNNYYIYKMKVYNRDNKIIHLGDIIYDEEGNELKVVKMSHAEDTVRTGLIIHKLYPTIYLELSNKRVIAILAREVCTKFGSTKNWKKGYEQSSALTVLYTTIAILTLIYAFAMAIVFLADRNIITLIFSIVAYIIYKLFSNKANDSSKVGKLKKQLNTVIIKRDR